jgi:PPM family protein phosphatase
MSFMTEAISRIGGRELNEDSYGFLEMNQAACWVVADGLGGHRGGELASKVAVDAVLESFRANPEVSTAFLRRHLEAAQQAVLQAQKKQPTLATMRTTIVMLLADGQRALWAHMGDSRLYCLENGRIVFCTKDHSVVQAMVAAGELPASRIRHHEDRNRLLRCLGNSEADFRPTILSGPRPLQPATAFLLCSDGFWENVTEPEIEIDFAKAEGPRDWLALMEQRLLERATDDSDNYTAVAAHFVSESPSPVASLPGAKLKVGAANGARLLRLGLIGVLLIVFEIFALQSWKRSYSLEQQVQQIQQLKEENQALVIAARNWQQKLKESQNQVGSAQNTSKK